MNKNLLKWLGKLLLTAVALYLLSKQIEWDSVKQTLLQANLFWLMPALFIYILSKVVSALRLNILQRQIPLKLSEKRNGKLYFIGMFYNLFLPGGIGGDGYKAIWLKQNYNVSTKSVISALFLDRFFGLAALFLLFFIGLFFTPFFTQVSKTVFWLVLFLFLFVIPVSYAITFFLFKRFLSVFWKALAYSIGVQLLQVVEALCILKSLSINTVILNYIVLFLASSVAAVLPISVGGIGVRELTFVYGRKLLAINQNDAVAFSLLFFLISAISSLIGAFLSMEKKNHT